MDALYEVTVHTLFIFGIFFGPMAVAEVYKDLKS